MSWKTCDNCADKIKYKCRGLHDCEYCYYGWKPIPCKLCGGPLSEIREHNGRKYRHCYACHMEFYEGVTE